MLAAISHKVSYVCIIQAYSKTPLHHAWGRLLCLVSGKKYTKKAIQIDGIPRINIGRGFEMQASFGINGTQIPSILEMVEHDPIAWVLRFVGYSSDVII